MRQECIIITTDTGIISIKGMENMSVTGVDGDTNKT